MKKILSGLLIISMIIALFPAGIVSAASDVSVEFDFEGFAGKEATQDSTTFDWMDYEGKSETAWTSANLVNSDTWLEPAARTGSGSGTAVRMVTKDGTTAFNASNQYPFMIRSKGHGVSETYPEVWFSFDWMVEDHNADHEMRAYLLKAGSASVQTKIFAIGTDGKLLTAAGATNISIEAGEWHNYEMCMSMTEGLLFYMDGQFLNKLSTVYISESNWMFLQTLKNNGSGQFKGTAMQFDNYRVTSYVSAQDKRLFGIKNHRFTESADKSSVTFTCTPYNVTDTDKPYLILLSVYDAEGRYVTYNMVSGTQASLAPENPVSVTVNQWDEEWNAKAYAFNSWTDRSSFSNKIYYKEPSIQPTVFVYKNFDVTTGGLSGFNFQANSGAALIDADAEGYYELSNEAEKYVADISFSGAGSEVMFEIMVKQTSSGAELNFFNVDSRNSFDLFLNIGTDGKITVGQTVIGSLDEGNWNKIAISTNFATNKMKVWLNDELAAQNIDRKVNTEIPVKIRLHRPESNIAGKTLIDNFYVYSGNEITEIDELPYSAISILGNDYQAQKSLKGKHAVHAYSNQIAVDGVRLVSHTPAFIKDDVIYAAQADLNLMLDAEVSATAGSNIVYVDSTQLSILKAAVEKDNAVYLPVKELAEELNMTAVQGERGVIVFADDEFTLDDDELRNVNDYLQYGRLTPAEVANLLGQKTTHPRTIISQEQMDVIRNAYLDNDEHFMNIYQPGASSDFVVNDNTSSSSLFWHMIGALSRWTASRNDVLKEKIWDIVEVLCNKPDWDTENDSLCRATSTICVAMAYDLLYAEWSNEQLSLMEDCIVEFGLKPIEKVLKGIDPDLTNVFAMGNNINAICASGAIIGAAAVWDKETELSSYVIAESMRGLEKVQSNFYPHGAWNEGADYAGYMMSLLPLGLSTIENVLGHDYGFLTAPGVKEHALFAMSTLGNCGANNYHDGSDWSDEQVNNGVAISWAAHTYKSPEYYRLRKDYINLSGISYYPQDILYYHPEWEDENIQVEYPLDFYFKDSEFFSMRSNYESDGIYFSGHFGAESASHSHFDNGTFVLDMMGERWALDLGKDDYTLPGYFVTGTRDQYYRVRPEGHNTFVINPDASLGHTYHGFGEIIKFESSDYGAIAIGDMTNVYEDSISAKRGFMLTDNRSAVIIRDEIRTENPSDIYWFMHTSADIEIVDDRTAILTKNGKQVKLSFISNVNNASISEMAAEPLPTSPNPDGQMTNEGVSKITIFIPSSDVVDLTVRITPVNSFSANNEIPNVSLEQWTVPMN